MNKVKMIFASFFVLTVFSVWTQNTAGYFGKKNMIGLHGTWFLRNLPQVFYKQKIFTYSEQSEEFNTGFFRNHIWHAGFSYKRLVSEKTAFGFQVDLGTRNIGSPSFDPSSKTYLNPWPSTIDESDVWSSVHEQFLRTNELEISKTNFLNRQVFLTWTRSKTATVFPLGLMSTLGLGMMHSAMNTSKAVYAKSYYRPVQWNSWSNEKAIFSANLPVDFTNNYLGVSWMWDLSLNYAISRNVLFSFGSEMRGVLGMFSLNDGAEILNSFPIVQQGHGSLEGLLYGRNFSKEIRREMIFQNTFRVGLIFMF